MGRGCYFCHFLKYYQLGMGLVDYIYIVQFFCEDLTRFDMSIKRFLTKHAYNSFKKTKTYNRSVKLCIISRICINTTQFRNAISNNCNAINKTEPMLVPVNLNTQYK